MKNRGSGVFEKAVALYQSGKERFRLDHRRVRFEGDPEEQLFLEYDDRLRRETYIRNGIIGFFVILVFAIKDYTYIGGTERIFPLIGVRAWTMFMVAVSVLVAMRSRSSRVVDYVVFATAITFGLSVAMVIYFLQGPNVEATATLMSNLAIYIFIPQVFIFSVVSGLVSMFSYLYLFNFVLEGYNGVTSVVGYSLVGLNILSLIYLREFHLRSRKSFVEMIGARERQISLTGEVERRMAVEKRLRNLANSDPLTGAANRRAFIEQLGEEIERATRHKHPLSLVFADLDYLKLINDTHGHQAGDDAILLLSRLAKRMVRKHDLVARLGGEEFALLLPETSLKGARELAERVRFEIEKGSSRHEYSITCSFGVAEFFQGEKMDSFWGRADTALYKAKTAGRNRVES